MIAGFGSPEDASSKLCNRLMTPFGLTTAESIAAAIAYVASEEAELMTGAVLSVDGGLTI